MHPDQTFLWHDYETFGTDPFADRPAQFAAIRTDMRLKPVGEPIDWYCAPANDVLPHPGACLVTGITPQHARKHGMCEADFARRVHGEMSEPGTCIVGYNSHRFDDTFTRNLFYRNFFDPYAHEYSNGNSRWDLIDLVRMCYALRPGGIEWPLREDGAPSFRLDQLSVANGIAHEDAHDALGDVRATIALAARVRTQQRRLFDWGLEMRDQAKVRDLLDTGRPRPVLHTSARIAATRGCTSLVLPVAVHPHLKKSVIVFDLMADPGPLLTDSAERIHDLVFASADELPEGAERLPLKEIKTNGAPMVAPAATLKGVDCGRIGLDPERCLEHARMLQADLRRISPKIMDVYANPPRSEASDPDLQLYSGGFFPAGDKRLLTRIRQAPASELGQSWSFEDPRLPEMLFRYRARNFSETLGDEELQRWETWRLRRLREPRDDRLMSLAQFQRELSEAREETQGDSQAQVILDQLEAWLLELGLG